MPRTSRKFTPPLLPLADYYVVAPDPPTFTSPTGLLVNLQTKPSLCGTVVAWGPDTAELRAGDRVAWRPFAGTTVEIGERSWLLLREEDIVCRLAP